MTYIDEYKKNLMVRTSEVPWGPFSEPFQIGGVPHDPSSELIHMGFEHPELRRNGGRRILVSYSQPRFLLNSLINVCWR